MRVPAAALFTTTFLAFAAPAHAETAPRAWLESLIERAKTLATKEIKSGTAEETAWKAEIKSVVDEIIDWDELTEKSLGRHWRDRSDPEKKRFSAALREMIEASYQDKLKLASQKDRTQPKDVTIEWLEESVNAKRGTAKCTARVKSGKGIAVLEFKMKKTKKAWRVFDVSIDDVSTVRTYRSQFGKIIARDGFDALMKRIEAKIAQIRAGKGTISPP